MCSILSVKKRNNTIGDSTSSPESMQQSVKGAVVSGLKCNGAGISVCLLPFSTSHSDKHLSMHAKCEYQRLCLGLFLSKLISSPLSLSGRSLKANQQVNRQRKLSKYTESTPEF